MAQDHIIFTNSSSEGDSANGPTDAGLRQFLLHVYTYMAGALCVSGISAYLAIVSGFYQWAAQTGFIWLVIFSPLAVLLFLTMRMEKIRFSNAVIVFLIYACLMGLSLAGIFLIYTNQSITQTFFISAAIFGATSFYGYVTKTDLSRLGSFLMMGLIAIILVSAINIFLGSTNLQIAVSTAGTILFIALTAYDTQRLKDIYYASDPSKSSARTSLLGALTLYLDFINLFMLLLRLTGARRK